MLAGVGCLLFVLLAFFVVVVNPTASESSCVHHKDCTSCVQDPCSRYWSQFHCYRTDGCGWCNEQSLCLPADLSTAQCRVTGEGTIYDMTGKIDCVSSSPPPAVVSNSTEAYATESPCRIPGNKLAVDLSDLPEMQQEPSSKSSSPYFYVALHLCCPVSNQSAVGRVCGSRAELQLLEVADGCVKNISRRDTSQRVSRQYCWDIVRDLSLPKWLNSESDPSQGGWIIFGSLNCCPWNGTQPSPAGTPGHLQLRIKVEPPDEDEYCSNPDYVELTGINTTDFQDIFMCSLSRSEYFDIVVKTSRLCARNIDYELNVTLTELTCGVHQMNDTVVCRVAPRRTDGNVTSDFVCTLHHFEVKAVGILGATTYSLKELATVSSDKCVFSLSRTGVQEVIVTYLFGSSGEVRNISGSPCRLNESPTSQRLYMYIILGSVVGGCLCIAFVIICIGVLVYQKKCHGSYHVSETSGALSANVSSITSTNSGMSQEGEHTNSNSRLDKSFVGQESSLEPTAPDVAWVTQAKTLERQTLGLGSQATPDGDHECEPLLCAMDTMLDQSDGKDGSVDGPESLNIKSSERCSGEILNDDSDSRIQTERLAENGGTFSASVDPRRDFADSTDTGRNPEDGLSTNSWSHHTQIIVNDDQTWIKTVDDMQIIVKGLLRANKKASICVIRRCCDEKLMCDEIYPTADLCHLHVFDIQHQKLGGNFIDFVEKSINLSSYFIIICSPGVGAGASDSWFKYMIDLALRKDITNSSHKLLIVSTDGKEDTLPEVLRVFTFLRWNLEDDKQRLTELLKSIS